MTRRNIELMLLLIASPIVIVLFAMMQVTGGQLSFNTSACPSASSGRIPCGPLPCACSASAADPAILPISFALSGVGIAFVTRIVSIWP